MKKDLEHLRPKDAREILALAAMAVRARQAQRPPMIQVHLVGPITRESLREVAHGLLEERRRAAGYEAVDLADLMIRDDWRPRDHAIYTDQPASRGADVTSVAGGPASRALPG